MIIPDNESLKHFIPNTLVEIDNELSLYDKLEPFLASSEQWLNDWFTGPVVMQTITDMTETNEIRQCAQKIVVNDAFAHAIPYLDLILTPTGFGIVSNNNVSPASKERVDRLISRLIDSRDELLMQFQKSLLSLQWYGTEQCMFFQATMLPFIDITLQFPRGSQPRWEQYLSLREAIIPVEEFFANLYLSQEELAKFRYELPFGDYHDLLTKRIYETLQAIEVRTLITSDPTSAMYFEHTALCDIVNAIRQNANLFPQWHNSETAKLFNPTIFENKKTLLAIGCS